MALMSLSPLSEWYLATFPQVFSSGFFPAVPNPILVLQDSQSFSLFAMMPILALERSFLVLAALNPSLLQFSCKEASGPISVFQVSRPNEVWRYSRVQRVGLLFDNNEFNLLTDLHSKTDLGERCVPVGR